MDAAQRDDGGYGERWRQSSYRGALAFVSGMLQNRFAQPSHEMPRDCRKFPRLLAMHRLAGVMPLPKVLVEQAVVQKRGSYRLAVAVAHSRASHLGVPSLAHRARNSLEHCFRRRLLEQETPMTAQQVGPVGVASEAAAGHREIAPFPGDHRRGRQVEGGAQPPSPSPGEHRVIARVVVQVGDGCVEAHPAEKLEQIVFRFGAWRRTSSASRR